MSMPLTLPQLFDRFPDDAAAEGWLVGKRWPDGVRCPSCDADDVQARPTRKPQPYRGRVWVIALYLLTSRPKGVSSRQLHRDLGISYKAAWYLSHRIREAYRTAPVRCQGPADTDEAAAYRGLSAYRHASVHHGGGEYGRGPVHTNRIESFWALFKRGFRGTYHSVSPKHLHRYAREFEGRHNHKADGALQHMACLVQGMEGSG
ncbi:MAG: transposase [Caldilineaceae bacterium]|nr:transposase [Caldilineaceae bacterium]